MDRKSKCRSISVVMIVGLLSVLLISSPLFAANGAITCWHGVSGTSTYGKITSTKKESSMQIKMKLWIDGYEPTTFWGTKLNNTSSIYTSANVAGLSGSSYCYYYVSGKNVHKSTDRWYFNFT